MKKFAIFLTIVVGIVVLFVLVLGVIAPTDVIITRSVLIKAPKDTVFAQVVNFKNWPRWSAWHKIDTTMKITYTGTDGESGSAYHWVGNENKIGEGEMSNTGVNGTQMDYALHLITPFPLEATGSMEVKDTAKDNVKVTWILKKHTPYPLNAMSVFMDMDKLMGGDFELGLGNMKKYLESTVPAVAVLPPLYEGVKEVDYPAHIIQGVRKVVKWNEIGKFCMDGYAMLGRMAGAKINGPAMALYYTWDTAGQSTDMVVAFPVSDSTLPVKDAPFIYLPASKAVMAAHKGGYSQMKTTHTAIAQYITAKGKMQGIAIEEYITGPKEEPDSNKWVTNIYYLVK